MDGDSGPGHGLLPDGGRPAGGDHRHVFSTSPPPPPVSALAALSAQLAAAGLGGGGGGDASGLHPGLALPPRHQSGSSAASAGPGPGGLAVGGARGSAADSAASDGPADAAAAARTLYIGNLHPFVDEAVLLVS